MGSLEELLKSWRDNPDAPATIALAGQLSGTADHELLSQVGAHAEAWHQRDPEVLLAVGHMYLQSRMWQEAQSALVAAGKANSRDPRIFRYLGEVLLRRGDAIRSEKVLERALQLGLNTAEVRELSARARSLVPLQEQAGAQTVAEEVGRQQAPPTLTELTAASGSTFRFSQPEMSSAERILLELERVGVYQTEGGPMPGWETAPSEGRRGAVALLFALVTVLVVGLSALAYSRLIRSRRAQQANFLTETTLADLKQGGLKPIMISDDRLRRAFELDPSSRRVALVWLRSCILRHVLVAEDRCIGSAIARAKSLGASEADLAGGTVIQYAESNDLAGALQALIRWDRRAASDPYYQLAVGFALERAGDLRALVRYQAALALDSDLMVAEQLLARLAVLELGSERSRPLVDSVARKLGDRAEARALRGLLWAVGSEDTEDAPERARISVREVDELPRPLRAVPYLLEAHQAVGLSQVRAHQSLERALELADSPQMAAAVGLFAIRTGDEPLAAQAARRSSFLAPGYARAGGIQLRAALLGGRIDEAERLSIQFGTSSVAALVSAAAAYERLELRRLKSALEMLGPLENPLDDTGLAAGAEMLASGVIPSATKLELMARPVVPWGELVATDAALDSGNFELAEKLMGKWSETHGPAYQLRIARLLRYRGKTEEALRKSQALVEAGFQTPPAVIEYLYALVESGAILKAAEALEQHKERLGPSAAWFSAILLVASGQPKVAQVKLATVPLPVEQTPLMLKALAARAIAAAKDVRARPYVAAMAKRAPRHPDIAAAVALLAAR